MSNKELYQARLDRLLGRITEQDKKLNKLNYANQIIYCNNCNTYHDKMEGMRQPDYEGYCPACHEETNIEDIFILDHTSLIIDLLNENGVELWKH